MEEIQTLDGNIQHLEWNQVSDTIESFQSNMRRSTLVILLLSLSAVSGQGVTSPAPTFRSSYSSPPPTYGGPTSTAGPNILAASPISSQASNKPNVRFGAVEGPSQGNQDVSAPAYTPNFVPASAPRVNVQDRPLTSSFLPQADKIVRPVAAAIAHAGGVDLMSAANSPFGGQGFDFANSPVNFMSQGNNGYNNYPPNNGYPYQEHYEQYDHHQQYDYPYGQYQDYESYEEYDYSQGYPNYNKYNNNYNNNYNNWNNNNNYNSYNNYPQQDDYRGYPNKYNRRSAPIDDNDYQFHLGDGTYHHSKRSTPSVPSLDNFGGNPVQVLDSVMGEKSFPKSEYKYREKLSKRGYPPYPGFVPNYYNDYSQFGPNYDPYNPTNNLPGRIVGKVRELTDALI
ncbi:5'-3' exoribonuclease [Planoprotostelium fungivorum]|uniref:5'-3' exoribonuclease n=1 Tax=Planoprotostelium fungivorum TaxID=1890364 RepID=A0A2P6NLN1_9EUKA|nr:5'-3' exoribonuclease [Planoprotostelium fungivorum]